MNNEKKVLKAYYKSGALRLESELDSEGVPDGTCFEYYENGKLKTEQNRRKGVFHGRFRQWREDGLLLGEFSFLDGTGQFIEWYPNGRIKVEMGYVDGLSHGVEKLFDTEGNCCLTNYYFRDKKVSKKKYLELSALSQSEGK